ncbi:hypothetical protein CEXT_707651 [Caerostris extrusa]|uniref:Uncharacterized protein n=1 Tax=Caerostris extrusa TaxID=172846 RepID=A0AAV4X3M7_CAEEX|nr:hypothetical protein CEXT_707651 [Caerostris extrusa]
MEGALGLLLEKPGLTWQAKRNKSRAYPRDGIIKYGCGFWHEKYVGSAWFRFTPNPDCITGLLHCTSAEFENFVCFSTFIRPMEGYSDLFLSFSTLA